MSLADLAKAPKLPANRCKTCWLLGGELPEDGEDGAAALREALASGAPSQSIASELARLGYDISNDAITNHRRKH